MSVGFMLPLPSSATYGSGKSGKKIVNNSNNGDMPADDHPAEIILPEKTEIIEEPDKIMKRILEEFQRAKRTYDTCGDHNLPISTMTVDPVWQSAVNMIRRGVKARCITEVTKENVVYCKEISKEVELRHLDSVKGSFTIVDGTTCMLHPEIKMRRPPTVIIYSTARSIVEMQNYMFESLWKNAIPAEEKVRELEQGTDHETIDTLRDHEEILRLVQDLIRQARDEILIIFSTANAFHRQESAGSIELLVNAAKSNAVRTRILVPFDSRIVQTLKNFEGLSQNRITIKSIESDMQTRISIVISDRKHALSVELRDDTKATSIEAMGLATYSNSDATVSSYVAIFESLWHQAEMYERLRMHDEMQREFINIAAHELRTPIQPILGLTSILLEQSKERHITQQQELLEAINRNANRLYNLTENLLDLARIENQSLQLNKEPLNLVNIIKDVIEDIQTSRCTGKVKFSLVLPAKNRDVNVYGDRERITQVLSNLLNNSVKFTKEGMISVVLEEKKILSTDGKLAVISIRDSGIGIDPNILPRLFEKFVSRSEKGSGLGLFISKGIIEAHGGKIWAKNNEEEGKGIRGATFAFSLPLVSEDSY